MRYDRSRVLLPLFFALFLPGVATAQTAQTDWSGFSAGGHGAVAIGDFFGTFNGADAPLDFTRAGTTQGGVGFQLGYTYQFANRVTLGIGTDMSFPFGSSGSSVSGAGDTIETSIDFLALGQLRLGYALGRFHFYGAGGIAFVDYSADIFDASSGLSTDVGEGNAGVVLGGGAAWRATDRISLFVDGSYIILDDENDISTILPGADAGDRFAIDGVTIIRFGASFHF